MGLGAEQTMHRAWSPDYAAPEQVRGERLDAQADVYSLGVILRELLAGPSPGLTVSKAERRELEAIGAAALRDDKALRYRSVEHLLADLARFENHEPLKARAGALRRYRVGKFIVRHRRPAAITAAVLLTIAALSLFFTLRLIEARDRAVGSEARTRRIHGLMLNLFSGDAAAAGPAASLRVVDLLERGVREAAALRDEPDLQADLRYTLGGLYHRLGHFDRADPLLTDAWQTRRALFGEPDPRTVRVQLAIAALRVDQDELEQADAMLRHVIAVAEGRSPVDATEVAAARALLGRIVAARGDFATAFPMLEDAVAVLSAAPPSTALSEALGELGNARYYHGEITEAEAIFERALRLDRTLFGPRHPHVAVDLLNLGNVALDRGEYDRALRLYREALGINDGWFRAPHPKIAHDLLMVGRSLSYLGQPRQAGEMYARALEQTLAVFPDVHPRVGQIYSLQGDLARDEGSLDEADRLFRKAAAIFGEASGETHQFTLHQHSNLASVLLARDDHRAAEAALRPVVARLAATVPRQRYTALAEIRLARALIGQKRYAEARDLALAGYARLRPLTGPANAELRAGRECLAAIYRGLGQPEKAGEFADPPRTDGLSMR
jgi:serine/threonine-protein kinase